MMYPQMNRTRPMPEMVMMERAFRDLFGMPDRRRVHPSFRVDVRETAAAYQLEAELPGVQLADIDISVENDVLTIVANIDRGERTRQEGYRHVERRSGRMERSFTLEGIDQGGITAHGENGVVTILLPKEQPASGKEKRRIAIATGSAPAIEAGAQ